MFPRFMIYEGNLSKMRTELDDTHTVHYFLFLNKQSIHLNEHIGKNIRLTYLQQINCIRCGRKTKKSFGQGFCYPCFRDAPEADQCIIHPELCQAHLGISRDMEWSEQHCLQPHFVYIANSGGIKVGVTRATQIPTRWIDQGAVQGIRIAQTPNRHLAGKIEVFLKQYFADKTNWQRMLKNTSNTNWDLLAEKEKAFSFFPEEFNPYRFTDDTITEIKYPVTQYPDKIKSFTFDKTDNINFTLAGIKGQYLIGTNGEVINIRRHNGYLVKFEIN